MDWLVKEEPPSYKDGVQTSWGPFCSLSTVTESGPGMLLWWSEFMLRVVSSCSTAQRRSSRRSICSCLNDIVSLKTQYLLLWDLQLCFPIGSGANLRPAARACLLACKTRRLAVPTRPGAITANLPQTFSIQCYALGLGYWCTLRILQPSHCTSLLVCIQKRGIFLIILLEGLPKPDAVWLGLFHLHHQFLPLQTTRAYEIIGEMSARVEDRAWWEVQKTSLPRARGIRLSEMHYDIRSMCMTIHCLVQ